EEDGINARTRSKSSALPCSRNQLRGPQPHLRDQRREAPACPCNQPDEVAIFWCIGMCNATLCWRIVMREAQLFQRYEAHGAPRVFKRPT
ncbi:hypothetical protein HAX54_014639, partial [Datura stramonium]|nr:hypothetical protein [Datura stramonium]